VSGGGLDGTGLKSLGLESSSALAGLKVAKDEGDGVGWVDQRLARCWSRCPLIMAEDRGGWRRTWVDMRLGQVVRRPALMPHTRWRGWEREWQHGNRQCSLQHCWLANMTRVGVCWEVAGGVGLVVAGLCGRSMFHRQVVGE
jgi:hypothetical protein